MHKLKIIFWTFIFINLVALNNYNLFSNVITSNIKLTVSISSEKLESIQKLLTEGNTKKALESLYIILKEAKDIRLSPSYSNQNYDDYKWLFSDVIKEIKVNKKPPRIKLIKDVNIAIRFRFPKNWPRISSGTNCPIQARQCGIMMFEQTINTLKTSTSQWKGTFSIFGMANKANTPSISV